MTIDNCSAAITGASAGIGREFARQLAKRAKLLILVARRRGRLEELRTELCEKNPALRVEVRQTDLSSLEQTMSLANWLGNQEIDLLINNAGLGDLGPFATAEPNRVNEQVQVNVLALTALTRAVLPRMLAQKRGGILNVSSSAGFLPLGGFAVYAATKAYVISWSEAIRAETRRSGISVTTVCPGPVHTDFTQVADRKSRPRQYGSGFIHLSAEKVVRAALRALERDQALVIPGLLMKMSMSVTRTLPLPLLRLAARFTQHTE